MRSNAIRRCWGHRRSDRSKSRFLHQLSEGERGGRRRGMWRNMHKGGWYGSRRCRLRRGRGNSRLSRNNVGSNQGSRLVETKRGGLTPVVVPLRFL